ncbi:hypothetical protein [Phaeobacter inhibens]|uniref:hypothetical protein n=1 Tax=Phaeobacter inhibens TaxID=221822 RepID=UPI000C9ABD45|nr:hypothetical protein [Phaeobacter inhibens]AUQ64393.1 hypothetical protein PhaeoP51_03462 [Phaeobacter inhibens]
MTDLIKAADALAEEVEIRLENGCEICNGDCSAANPPVQSCPQQRRLQLLTTYRQARESADGVKVKPLVWECEGGWRWKGTPPDGFFTSVAKWVWQAPKGGFKHAGTKEPFATLEEAKAAAQADYEARIKAALED